ncbi:folylpolyglutamate synthase [Drosophila grimshawi]|uniref:folylpolyglutamate synthase n=1 Tax=Drosophila grimshawi TaxID=7222 RepID=UPI001C9326E4|nr:folylpolyglutamate synthase [Drosophila grimshawi]
MLLLKSPAPLSRLPMLRCSNCFFKWSLNTQKQPQEQTINEKQLPKQLQKPKAVTPPIINIKDQRDKWLAKVSPKLPSKSKTKTAAGAGSKFPQQAFGMPQEFQQTQPPPTQSPNETVGSNSSSVSERNSWMNRMHGKQQTKQEQWLKDMQAKQQQGRDMQQLKMQKMQQSQSTEATETKSDEAPAEIVAKTPERLAYLSTIKQLNTYLIHEPVVGRAVSKTSGDQMDPNITHTLQCLSQTGLEPEQLLSLPVIQVAGTKGRGTTCLLVESILRAHGIKTGVLCAPHLFLTNERIRIDGAPLEETKFTQLFDELQSQLGQMQPPPSYNKLLTVMAFHAFRNDSVDVAIVEIGSACAGDCTNISGHAETIGISSLGWEQNFSLGNSLRDIAWAKAAIMKKDASIYTSASQTECCEVLGQRAKQLGVELHRVPGIPAYIESNLDCKQLLNGINFGVKLNASLAIQLAYDYLRRYQPEYVAGLEHNSTQLTPGTKRGLELFERRGQFEIMKHDIFNVHLDCADTLESMMMCREWFYTRTRSSRFPKILLFSKVNEYNSKDLLTILRHNTRFEEAGFVPSPSYFEGEPVAELEQESNKDENGNAGISWKDMEELQRARRNASNWRSLCEETGTRDNSHLSISIEAFFDHLRDKYGKQRYGMRNELDVLVTGSRELVAGTINYIQQLKNKEFGKWR